MYYSTLVCQNCHVWELLFYCLLIWSRVSKVFQGTFFYHATIEQGRTTHHPWVNKHSKDSKYGSLTNIGHLITSPIPKRQVQNLVVGILKLSFSEGFLCWCKGLQNSVVPKYSTHSSLYLAMGNCFLSSTFLIVEHFHHLFFTSFKGKLCLCTCVQCCKWSCVK
jgi:hypothetical protein